MMLIMLPLTATAAEDKGTYTQITQQEGASLENKSATNAKASNAATGAEESPVPVNNDELTEAAA